MDGGRPGAAAAATMSTDGRASSSSLANLAGGNVKGARVLVTGGAGFIGANLVRRLVREGFHVVVVDNLSRGTRANLLDADGRPVIDMEREFILGDLTDYSKCLEAIRNVFTVYHLADIVGGCSFIFDHEPFAYRQNMTINSNVLAACVANSVPNYIYVGTACSFPLHLQMDKTRVVALHENQTYPAQPESSYGWSKLMGEYEADLVHKNGRINVGILRLHNVYGPYSSYNPRDSQVLPSLIYKAIQARDGDKLSVWGSGLQYRDFVYVDDIVNALLLMSERGMNCGVIQVGQGQPTRIGDAAQLVCDLARQLTGKSLSIELDPSKPEGDFGRIAMLDRAAELLQWRPTVTFRQGLELTFKWILADMARHGLIETHVPAHLGLRKTLLVVGGAGYIGSSVVARALENPRYRVRVLDKLMYGGSALFRFFSYEDRFQFVYGDIRTYDLDRLLTGVDYVFNAAALVGEHICKKYPKDAREINEEATIKLAKACERNGVQRYIFASTCSNYGKSDTPVDETSPVNPLSLYAETKIACEKFLMNDVKDLPCTVLRFSTVYGLASRVRFDLLIHEFIRDAWVNKKISVYGPEGWRPFIHVDDAARAVLSVVEQHSLLPAKDIYNVGSNDQNYRKIELGHMVSRRLGAPVEVVHQKQDPRSYKVSFTKFHRATGFQCLHRPEQAIDAIATGLETGMITTAELSESVNVKAGDADNPNRPIAQARL